ncbi:hypothetical protein FHR32_002274 [Streptosporangium album]|uniref:Uncharacterized protein n=1 Tax=Streptosporangium album TaxID=47479 RepID=A0A7W7RTJ4_9ACTN|nr:hypothetical protein [Streptosporangium album]MBB4937969.1 hypothetical protein [Streptosporangium album]
MKARLLLLAVPLLLAGCGAASTTSGVASAGDGTAKHTASASVSASVDRGQAQLKFAQCMRENGVDMADPNGSGQIRVQAQKGEEAKMEKAMKECQHFMEDAVGDKGAANDPKRRDEMVKYVQCLRENGIAIDDPDPNGRLRLKMSDGSEQKMKAAEEACKEFAPAMKGSGR